MTEEEQPLKKLGFMTEVQNPELFEFLSKQIYITDSILRRQQKYPEDQRVKEDARINKEKTFQTIELYGLEWCICLDNWNDGKAQFLKLRNQEINLYYRFLILANWVD